MGFWPRLFLLFCLGFRTEAYWGEAKSCGKSFEHHCSWKNPSVESGNGGGGNGVAVNQRLQRTAAAATQRRGNRGAANSGGSDPAAAATQRRQRPSGEEMEVQRTSGGSDPAATTTQRRQRTSEPDGGGAKACAVSGSFVNLGDTDGLYASVSLGPEAEC
ncbi:hypothetical protein DEO72_LG11g3543 [Vigna unguiculata]|uniref:Uncharacterized protein n=1 Tax=Vigna unguiculata TaxID=3917 RepID=A0A4D6NSA8_VIGUN|nr:hypothetical protein DEO72_LG11g3543 [Vigna unguiculata]